jgi:hypothetical protein
MSINGLSHSVPPPDEFAPGWRVVSFVDPAGDGRDLAFTQGLEALDLPELLLWARPTEGFDPGADWLLTHRERSLLLGQWAHELVTGRLEIGSEREQRFDGGNTIARFRFPSPISTAELDHPQLFPQTELISIAWSLLRQAPVADEPPNAPLSPATERRMQRWISKTEAQTLGWRLRSASAGLSEDRRERLTALSISQPSLNRFGPATPWVDARIRQVLAADAEVIAGFLGRHHLADHARCEGCLLNRLSDLAIRTRRTAACREASRAAQELAMAVIGPLDRPNPIWDAVLAAIMMPFHDPDPLLGSMLSVSLTDGLETLLLTAVLSDLPASALIASGSGAWEWAAAEGRLPGRQWLAPMWARSRTRELLAQATPGQLLAAADRAVLPFGLIERQEVSHLITGIQTTAAASARPGSLFRRDQRRGLPRSVTKAVDLLAGELLTAVALPERLPPGGWDLIRDTLYPVAPELPPDRP